MIAPEWLKSAERAREASKCDGSKHIIKLKQHLTPKLNTALHISNFRVPSYVPVNLASNPSGELAKPLLFDCDYDYEPNEDSRLTVKWFRNKEAEPFYQWLPELNVRHLADWIRPLVNQSFVSDPTDPLKRYRSLLVKRLSLNLTGQYTCLVSSLAGQDYRMGSLVIYQPPRAFTFEHRVLPREQASSPAPDLQQDGSGWRAAGGRPTQFKVFTQPALIVRPANNDNQAAGQSANNGSSPSSGQRLVYTHDGRPVRKPIGKSKRQAADWMLRQRLAGSTLASHSATSDSSHALQLHHLQCSASQVTPRPTLVLTVKRDADSIAQYLHESSSLSIRPYQVGWQDYLQDLAKLRAKGELEGSLISKSGEFAASNASQPTVTLYDITVSATVALNVSLSSAPSGPSLSQVSSPSVAHLHAAGINTVLAFRRGQRMSFECQLEITGTEFEQRRRININEDGK